MLNQGQGWNCRTCPTYL